MREQQNANTHGEAADPAQIQAQVDQARERLRGTIDEIGTKMNVRAMAQDKSAKLTGRVRSSATGASKVTMDKARSLSATARTDGPKQLRRTGTQVASTVRTRNGKAVAVAIPVALVSLLVLRRIRKH
ncbi:Protein of unknown function [Actinopolymorpha cephalotaxi]|uniref:DUF3618 domain-containing protein n=1 Tax=Actinopolymorpha cephalotaxi TaxID=504797 RepID=A0A1I2PIK4_9ACTN|nr:DUF3618 domain-containing protein [Actinopolymorpha cephalotaxi]NYH83624.1 hypothetical protein [Actinopolymorpha cephalotaxi]SFG14929.1 Protein of unknown function [Actinopolymorpha cephalotaxi]